jgi:hypothetical protein
LLPPSEKNAKEGVVPAKQVLVWLLVQVTVLIAANSHASSPLECAVYGEDTGQEGSERQPSRDRTGQLRERAWRASTPGNRYATASFVIQSTHCDTAHPRPVPTPRCGLLRLPTLMDLYIHPLYILVSKILSSILNSSAPIHPLYHPLSTLSTIGPTYHFI